MAHIQQPHGAHLVGSVPLASAQEVFSTVSSLLGSWLRRIPDGETGARSNWIRWQYPFLARTEMLEDVSSSSQGYAPGPRLALRSSAETLLFKELGYAEAAIESYMLFAQLKKAGHIPAHCRFQVCLPTPIAPITTFIQLSDQAAVEPAYEAAMIAELKRITTAIPLHELAIQWDTAIEFALLEGVMPTFFTNVEDEILQRLIRLGEEVPAQVELGYHLCYGDSGHQHFKQPADTAKLVDVANALASRLQRPLHWLHMPVPRNRADDAYFAPLRQLHLKPETEFYLGLMHYTDGVAGAKERIAAAQKAMADFGVATECGMGRRLPETIAALLRMHSEVSSPVQ
ncbi:hypothetical protein EPA93_46480 [Ktedonosporobacter rubrisoli]|uniref:Methionine synthase n=1 Tax=Ktedonosporobacter rubrisoli TaxID=2509675 RepID=A0A4P6K588_KTERU|nr:hypothetical protein [Ktedonosporobacter rubrisoli]QBD83020.1 hypothetical protein EPA93_46480 [Ktedonosporobacter rubrisoli]